MKPNQKDLQKCFVYQDGILLWKDRGKGRSFRRGGKIAGWLRQDGYVHIQIGSKTYYAHCLVWCLLMGKWPIKQVDHIDLNRSNNRIENLRLVTSSQNAIGRGGIHPRRGIEILSSGKYRVKLKTQHLGCFDKIEDAQTAYLNAVQKEYGDFAPRPLRGVIAY